LNIRALILQLFPAFVCAVKVLPPQFKRLSPLNLERRTAPFDLPFCQFGLTSKPPHVGPARFHTFQTTGKAGRSCKPPLGLWRSISAIPAAAPKFPST
jgi:hypothetical protein